MRGFQRWDGKPNNWPVGEGLIKTTTSHFFFGLFANTISIRGTVVDLEYASGASMITIRWEDGTYTRKPLWACARALGYYS